MTTLQPGTPSKSRTPDESPKGENAGGSESQRGPFIAPPHWVSYHGKKLPNGRIGPSGCECGACLKARAAEKRRIAQWQETDGYRWMTLITRNDPEGWRR